MRIQPLGIILAFTTVLAASLLVIVFAIGLGGGQYAGGPLFVIVAIVALTAAAINPVRRMARQSHR